MKILYAIQGTGNGHVSRARDIYPELCKYGDVDVLISGIQADLTIPFPVKYKKYGMSFIFGKKGGVDLLATAKTLKLFKLIKDIREFPIQQYDLVINDFEPISAWACKRAGKPCISLSHQSAVLNKSSPKPAKADPIGKFILKHYAPTTKAYGFHFKEYAPNIFTPIIRKEVRDLPITDEGHYTVYLPAYDDETIIKHLSQFPNTKWHIFSKHFRSHTNRTRMYRNVGMGNEIITKKINNHSFIKSMASSSGVLCGAGFETPAEALFLKKKLLVIPMTNQYEQQCNAIAARGIGVAVLKELSDKNLEGIRQWLRWGSALQMNYLDNTADVVAQIIHNESKTSFQEELKGVDKLKVDKMLKNMPSSSRYDSEQMSAEDLSKF